MFTGIVTDIGEIVSVDEGGKSGDRRFVVATKHDLAAVPIGASIACSGCCLTVVDKGLSLLGLSLASMFAIKGGVILAAAIADAQRQRLRGA